MTTSMQTIPFHGEALIYVERDGAAYVALKPISDRLGLKWSGQHAKISGEPERWGVQIIRIPSGGGEQETTCIPVNRIAAWLFSIHPNKVAEHLRDALIRYQTEAADVLDRHFRLKRDEDAAEIADLRWKLKRSHAHLLGALPKWAAVKALSEAGIWYREIGKRTRLAADLVSYAEEEMRRCGMMAAGEWDDGSAASLLARIRTLELTLRAERQSRGADTLPQATAVGEAGV